jgi:hypothetical protein
VAYALDEGMNRSEHRREAFDARGLDLPAEATVVRFGEGNVLVAPLPEGTSLPSGLTDAPDISAGSREQNAGANHYPDTDTEYWFGFEQDTYGGIRHVQEVHEGREHGKLPKGACSTIDASVDADDAVSVVDLKRNQLTVSVDGDITICNESGESLSKVDLSGIYIQVQNQ